MEPEIQPAPPSRPSYAWVYPIVFALALVVFGAGIYAAARDYGFTLLAAGAACVIGSLLVWPMALIIQSNRSCAEEHLRMSLEPLNERLEQFSVMLNLMSEQQLLSDRGKAIAYRAKDADAIRRAIAEDITNGDYEAAYQLANDMAGSFGYRQEADRIRAQIDERVNANVRRRIADHVSVIDRHTRAEQWLEAHQEAERMTALFPGNQQVAHLPAEIEARRAQVKRQLLESWQSATNRKDVDGSVEIIKRLDNYLTPAEADQLQEQARSAFKLKLENLKTRFTAAVHGQSWAEAIRLGDEIVAEFPNTQMAKEVRDMTSTLRQRASETAAATAGAA